MKTNKHLWLFGLTVFALAISAGSTMAQPDPYWAETSDTQTLPLNAELGGSDRDGLKLPLCWTGHLGGIHPGKVFQKQCLIPYGGKELAKSGGYTVYLGLIKWHTDQELNWEILLR